MAQIDMSKFSKYKDPRDKRLALDEELVKDICKRSTKISFTVTTRNKRGLAEAYEITYKLKSIVSINKDQSPNYGSEHTVKIVLPDRYPAEAPMPSMVSETWHPNIRATNPYKGRICTNSKAIAAYNTLDTLILRIGEILQYKNYLAEDKPPYPEDIEVAKWVREYAEPKGIVNHEKEIYVDYSELIDIPDDQVKEVEDINIVIDLDEPSDNDDIEIIFD